MYGLYCTTHYIENVTGHNKRSEEEEVTFKEIKKICKKRLQAFTEDNKEAKAIGSAN